MNRTRRTFFAIMGLTAAGAAAILVSSKQNLLDAGSLNVATILAHRIRARVDCLRSHQEQMAGSRGRRNSKPRMQRQNLESPSTLKSRVYFPATRCRTSSMASFNRLCGVPARSPGLRSSTTAGPSGHNRPAMTQPCKPTIYTPSGLAMWRPMAEALGWPSKKIGWKTLIELAADPQGWSRYGHPEWGKLKLGYTHPQYSNAGLLFLTSVIYGITGQTGGLKAEQVYDPRVEQALSAMAQHTSKYGMLTTDLFDMMARHGPDYLHAISAFEEGTVRMNLEHAKELRWPLVFLFPIRRHLLERPALLHS